MPALAGVERVAGATQFDRISVQVLPTTYSAPQAQMILAFRGIRGGFSFFI